MRRIILFTFLLLFFAAVRAQDTTSVQETEKEKKEKLPPAIGDVFKPSIGLGAGMLSFYGDVYSKNYQAPWTSRVAYDLTISQPLTESLRLNFYVMFGRLGANERINDKRFVNFESEIRLGGLNVMYSFDHLFKKDFRLRPWISLGAEGFEFLSKTDMYDRFGNKYFYWSDGSIRNMDESASGAQTNAIELVRDYTYESDIREMNLDGFGKYPERSWAIPVGLGALFKVGDRVELKLGTTFRYSFTDYIDGLSDESKGNRAGNRRRDCFVMTSFSLHYDLVTKGKNDTLPFDHYEGVDMLVIDNDDYDADGVRDLDDRCHGTPPAAKVDSDGCGVDSDGDKIPDHNDKEENTPAGAVADGNGVEYSEERGAKWYELYYDSTGIGADYVTIGNIYKGEQNVTQGKEGGEQKEYVVELARFKDGVPEDIMLFLLSIGDVQSANDGESTVYTAGNYNDLKVAMQRKDEFVSQGIKDVKIGVYKNGKYSVMSDQDVAAEIAKGSGTITGVTPKNPGDTSSTTGTGNTTGTGSTTGTGTDAGSSSGVVFRVQLGAYKKRINPKVFGKDAAHIIEIQTNDGYYRYVSGAYKNMQDAAVHRADLILDGYPDAFITAYKDGKRISLKDAGATFENKKDEKENLNEKEIKSGSVDKNLLVYKVQLSVRKDADPAFEAQLKDLKDVEKQPTVTGMIRYTAGRFSSYKDAVKLKDQLVQAGFSGAFVIALFKDEVISLQEAFELEK